MKTSHYDYLLIAEAEGIVTLTINRPETFNQLSTAALQELLHAVQAVATATPRARALIVTGSGEQAFIAGLIAADLVTHTPQEGSAASELGQAICRELERMPIVTISAVNGMAIGGGSEIAMACDLSVASTNAKFQQIEVLAGLIPGFGGTWRLARRVGAMRARLMIYAALLIDAPTARDWGLVLEVVEPAQLLPRCREIAASIAANSAEAVAEAKRVFNAGSELPLDAANDIERRAFAALFGTADMQQRMQHVIDTWGK